MTILPNQPPAEEPVRGIRAVDQALLNLFTRISHFVQVHTGLTNFFIAKCLGVVAAGFAVIDLVADYSAPRTAEDFAHGEILFERLSFDGIGLVYLSYLLIIKSERVEQQFFAAPNVLPLHYLVSQEPCRWRPILFTLALFHTLLHWTLGSSFWSVLRSTQPIWILLSLYFTAVVPLPPGGERVRERGWEADGQFIRSK